MNVATKVQGGSVKCNQNNLFSAIRKRELALLVVAAAFLLSPARGLAMPFFQLGANNGGTLYIQPTTVTVPASSSYTFFANGGRGNRTYSVVSGAGSINSSTGVFSAAASGGTTVIRVTDSGGATADATVTVVGIVGITVSQGYVSGGIGGSIQITAEALNSPSGSADITTVGTWTTTNGSVATVSNGLISFVGGGTATVQISYGGYTASVSVNVASKTLTGITISPSSKSMGVNATQDFVATATYSDASTQDITDTVTWSTTNASVANISNTAPTWGRAQGISAGSVTVTATLGSVSGSASLTITAATLVSIAVTPADAMVASSAAQQMTATGTFSDASTSNITNQVTWSSSNTSAATISNTSGSQGLATTPSFTGFRSTTITATLGAVSGSTTLNVTGVTVTAITVNPTVTITVGSNYQLSAIATLSDGGTLDVTTSATWSSSNTSNVTVSNSVGYQGRVTGIAIGTSSVSATFGGQTGSRTVTVGAAPVVVEEGTGLLGEYYNWSGGSPPANPFTAGNKVGQRVDARVNFNWAAGSNPMGVDDNFAVRWTGQYEAVGTTNYFCTYSDDGVRVWLNGVQIINNWTDHGATWNCSSNRTLTIGTKYTIQVEFYERGGNATMYLTRWTSSFGAQNTSRAIPQVDLYPP